MKVKTSKILAKDEGEFSTQVVFQSGGSFFYAVKNGGESGSHSVNNRFPNYLEQPVEISRDEMLAKCAAMGVEEVDIDE